MAVAALIVMIFTRRFGSLGLVTRGSFMRRASAIPSDTAALIRTETNQKHTSQYLRSHDAK